MTLPIIAIVGRPNVGKSRLFNRLIGRYQALVDDQPGVTRDRHYAHADWRGRSFLLVDTGGLIPGAENPLDKKVWQQAFQAIREADSLICLFDGQQGPTPVDRELVHTLRKETKPVFYVVNKVDDAAHETASHEFSELGLPAIYPVSAEHGRGIGDLLDALVAQFPPSPLAPSHQGRGSSIDSPLPSWEGVGGRGELRVAVVGRPNVGKSTFINTLVGDERVVVDATAGTTRDTIDVRWKYKDQDFLFVDTAGVKKKNVVTSRLEKFSVMKTLASIERSHIVCLLIDAFEGLTRQDLHLAQFAWEAGRGLILLANKWDLVTVPWVDYKKRLGESLGFMRECPKLATVAKTGEHCDQVCPGVLKLYKKMSQKLSTGQLNRWLEDLQSEQPPPSDKGRRLKLYYGTQIGSFPPNFIFFSNAPKGIPVAYQRFLTKELGSLLNAEGIPIRVSFKIKK